MCESRCAQTDYCTDEGRDTAMPKNVIFTASKLDNVATSLPASTVTTSPTLRGAVLMIVVDSVTVTSRTIGTSLNGFARA